MYEGYKVIIVEKQDKVLIIKFNNPKKKNCLNAFSYEEIARCLREASKDDSLTIVVITGVADYFTAGNDLSAFSTSPDVEDYIKKANHHLKEMISAFIECSKVLIALVNGPSIGIGTTMSALCDLVWCSDNAFFHTPFTQLGLVPEACSSYLFPLLFGRSKATEMLLFSEKLTAKEAYQYKFVTRIFKLSELNSVILPKIREFSQLPPQSMTESKRLLRMQEKEFLYKAANAECDELKNRIFSDEVIEALRKFAMRKSKI